MLDLLDFLEPLVTSFLRQISFSNSSEILRNNAISSLAQLAHKVREQFEPYLKASLDVLQSAMETHDRSLLTKGLLFESVSYVSCSVKKSTFLSQIDIDRVLEP